MCYAASCNPRCGDCRPRRIIDATCPVCGMENEMGREEFLILSGRPHKPSIMERKMIERGGVEEPTCRICGTNLLEAFEAAVVPLPCTRSRITCGFPCGRRNEPHIDGVPPCLHMVPMGKLEDD